MVSSGNIARTLTTRRLLMLEPLAVASVREAQEGGGGRRPESEGVRVNVARSLPTSGLSHSFLHITCYFLIHFSLVSGEGSWGQGAPFCHVLYPISRTPCEDAHWPDLGPFCPRRMCPWAPASQLRLQGPRPGSTWRVQASLRTLGE